MAPSRGAVVRSEELVPLDVTKTYEGSGGRVETESGGTRRRSGGEVKGKEANGVGSQQSSAWLGTVHPVLLQSFSADPHSKKASTRLN